MHFGKKFFISHTLNLSKVLLLNFITLLRRIDRAIIKAKLACESTGLMKFKGGCDLRILCDLNHKINKNITGAQAHNSITFLSQLKDVGEKKSFLSMK